MMVEVSVRVGTRSRLLVVVSWFANPLNFAVSPLSGGKVGHSFFDSDSSLVGKGLYPYKASPHLRALHHSCSLLYLRVHAELAM
jgi:hypothetical protein